MLLSRNEILAANDRPTHRVAVPEFGEGAEVLVRVMSAHDWETYESHAVEYNKRRAEGDTSSQDLYALMAVLSCCDEQGEPLFTLQDMPWLGKKSHTALKRIFDEAWALNHLGDQEVERAADFLEPTPANDSGTT